MACGASACHLGSTQAAYCWGDLWVSLLAVGLPGVAQPARPVTSTAVRRIRNVDICNWPSGIRCILTGVVLAYQSTKVSLYESQLIFLPVAWVSEGWESESANSLRFTHHAEEHQGFSAERAGKHLFLWERACPRTPAQPVPTTASPTGGCFAAHRDTRPLLQLTALADTCA
ncbi:hypothetical protein D3C80_1448210 [compost metagenome]